MKGTFKEEAKDIAKFNADKNGVPEDTVEEFRRVR